MPRSSAPPPSLASVFERPVPAGGEFRTWMSAWGERAVFRLRALGLQVDGCTTDEDCLLFIPDGRLMLAVEARSHVEVSLQLPPRDVPALRARLSEAERALELITAIEALPEQFETGVAGDGRRVPASSASVDALRALLERVEREQQPLWLGWRVSRAAALTHAALLDDLLEDALVALGGLLARMAWAPPRAAHLRPGRRAPIDKGARVRVLEGPFAGKVGVVQERDGRGGARVMLGPLAVRLDVKDVVACAPGGARALLSSSHRKPLSARRVRS